MCKEGCWAFIGPQVGAVYFREYFGWYDGGLLGRYQVHILKLLQRTALFLTRRVEDGVDGPFPASTTRISIERSQETAGLRLYFTVVFWYVTL